MASVSVGLRQSSSSNANLISLSYNFVNFVFQIIVVVITGTLFGINLYGTLMLRQYFDPIWFLPPETMGYKYSVTNSKVRRYIYNQQGLENKSPCSGCLVKEL